MFLDGFWPTTGLSDVFHAKQIGMAWLPGQLECDCFLFAQKVSNLSACEGIWVFLQASLVRIFLPGIASESSAFPIFCNKFLLRSDVPSNKQIYGTHGVPLQFEKLLCLPELLNIKPELIYTLLVKLRQTTHDNNDIFSCKLLNSIIGVFSTLFYPVFCSVILILNFPDICKPAFVIQFLKLTWKQPSNQTAAGDFHHFWVITSQTTLKPPKTSNQSKQFIFQCNESPILQILTYFEQISTMNSDLVFADYCDFSKAFDNFRIRIFLSKLHNFDIDDDYIPFLESYLTNSYQLLMVIGR